MFIYFYHVFSKTFCLIIRFVLLKSNWFIKIPWIPFFINESSTLLFYNRVLIWIFVFVIFTLTVTLPNVYYAKTGTEIESNPLPKSRKQYHCCCDSAKSRGQLYYCYEIIIVILMCFKKSRRKHRPQKN